MDVKQNCTAIQNIFIAHPWLQATTLFVVLLSSGICVGIPLGMCLDRYIRKTSERLLDWIGVKLGLS